MKKLKYEILRKNILSVSLISLTSKNWTSSENATIPWVGTTYIGPAIGDVVYNNNVTPPLVKGYYKWGTPTVNTWNLVIGTGTTEQEIQSHINSQIYENYQIPLFLDAKADELGVMVGFDGDIEQVDQLCNFVYSANTGNTLTVYNSASNIKLKRIIDATFRIDWGDGSATQSIGILSGLTKTYSTAGTKSVSITMTAPWKTETVTKDIKLPLTSNTPTDLASFTYTGATLPYFNVTGDTYLQSGRTQNYNNNYDYSGNSFTGTTIFLALGKSRKIEKKLYGGNTYSGVTGTTIAIEGTTYNCDKYVIDGLTYLDLSDGTTYITGNTATFLSEAQFTKKLTRNEHYLGFVSEPVVYSDIFVERGKMGVSEFNLRLGEIDNIGELDIYGNGFFLVKKQ